MDEVYIKTLNLEYDITAKKKLRSFSYDPFSRYEITIEFKNNIGMTVLELHTYEKNLVAIINIMSSFVNNMYAIYSDIAHFADTTEGHYFIVLGDEMRYSENDDLEKDYIEPKRVSFAIYNETILGNKLRLSFYTSYDWIEQFCIELFALIEDLDYIQPMIDSIIQEMCY